MKKHIDNYCSGLVSVFLPLVAVILACSLKLYAVDFDPQPDKKHSNIGCWVEDPYYRPGREKNKTSSIQDDTFAKELFKVLGNANFHSLIINFAGCYGGGMIDNVADEFKNTQKPIFMTSGSTYKEKGYSDLSDPTKTNGQEQGHGRWAKAYGNVHTGKDSAGNNKNPTEREAFNKAKKDQAWTTPEFGKYKNLTSTPQCCGLNGGDNIKLGGGTNGSGAESYHAILFGGDPRMHTGDNYNRVDFWNDIARQHKMLVKSGYKPENITVLYGDGKPPSINDKFGEVTPSEPTDGKQGTPDPSKIKPATKEELLNAIENLKKNMGPHPEKEQVYIYLGGHGSTDKPLGDPVVLPKGTKVPGENCFYFTPMESYHLESLNSPYNCTGPYLYFNVISSGTITSNWQVIFNDNPSSVNRGDNTFPADGNAVDLEFPIDLNDVNLTGNNEVWLRNPVLTDDPIVVEMYFSMGNVATTAVPGFGGAWNFTPEDLGTNVNLQPRLSWIPGDLVAYGGLHKGEPSAKFGNGHHLLFHTNENIFDQNVGQLLKGEIGTVTGHIVGASDSNFIDIANYLGGSLQLDTTYWWCVIEVNDANSPLGDPNTFNDEQFESWAWKSKVYQFRTIGRKASCLNPYDGSTREVVIGGTLEIELNWSPGYYAAETNAHDVYFGTDWDGVNYAYVGNPMGVYKGRQTAATYMAGGLSLGKTYYWRIDEVNLAGPDPCLWKGDVWSFKVVNYLVVDDFESYTETSPYTIYETWIDGYSNGTGSIIGLADPPYVELIYTYGGWQSMPYWYDNSVDYGTGYYSEAEADTSKLEIGSDWDRDGVKALTLYFYGDPDNDANATERMYLVLEDGVGRAAVVYYDGNLNAVREPNWHEWNIKLTDFNNIDLNNVNKVYIGFGNRYNHPTPGGSGLVFFDELRLYPPRCVPEYGPSADFTYDCVVNLDDVEVMSKEWLTAGIEADIYLDGIVNFRDLAVLANQWMTQQFWP